MHYCNNCILPDTRPGLVIMPDGKCNACHSWHSKKDIIDWKKRKIQFDKLVTTVQEKSKSWDCIIPVSGGKDSTWQVIKALEYGMKPLCVTWRTPARSKLGQSNLDNLINLGVDHIDFSINPEVEKKFTLKALREKGSVAIPMHMALFSIPLQIAYKFDIPLVLWGENSAMEYGADNSNTLGVEMNREWLLAHGVTNGTVAEDWIDSDLTAKDMSPYLWVSDSELQEKNIKAAFLGWYFKWDPQVTYDVAKQHGFKALSDGPKVGAYDFADVDDEFLIPIHHWIKWYKFGFTRAWDNLSIEIRNGRISRSQALETLKRIRNQEPRKEMSKFAEWAGISLQELNNVIEKFRNRNIWYQENSIWKIKDFIFDDWKWD